MKVTTVGKFALLLFLVGLMLASVACSSQVGGWGLFGKSRQGEDDTPFTTRSHTGTNGMAIAFTKDQPPSTMFFTGEWLPINVILELRNRGATNIEDGEGYLYLSGYDRNIIKDANGLSDPENRPIPFRLEGVTNFNPEGEYTTIEFEKLITAWPPGTDVYEPKFRASVCYKYQTVATPVVCIDPHPFSSLEERKVCRVKNAPMTGGQGAPIQVTSVEEEATENFVYFNIHISNANSRGVVFDPDTVIPFGPGPSSCPFNILYKDINKVYYTPPTFIGNGDFNPTLVECKPDTTTVPNGRLSVRLVDNRATIRCKYAIPRGLKEEYQTPLTINLDYGYLEYDERQIRIKNAAG